jgi:hypothetical protein
VREIWLYVSIPLALAIVTILGAWAASRGVVGNPHHMTMGDLGGRILVAIVAAAATITVIPWLIGLFNEAAQGMRFIPIDPSQLHHNWMNGATNVLNYIAMLVLAPIIFLLLLFSLIRWVLLTIWCIVSPAAAAAYTYPGTEDWALTFAKGIGAMLVAPVADSFLLSVMWWIVVTGHDIFPTSWGAWLDAMLIVVLALSCLVVELWAITTALGIRNFSGLKRALRTPSRRAIYAIGGPY